MVYPSSFRRRAARTCGERESRGHLGHERSRTRCHQTMRTRQWRPPCALKPAVSIVNRSHFPPPPPESEPCQKICLRDYSQVSPRNSCCGSTQARIFFYYSWCVLAWPLRRGLGHSSARRHAPFTPTYRSWFVGSPLSPGKKPFRLTFGTLPIKFNCPRVTKTSQMDQLLFIFFLQFVEAIFFP